MPVRVSALAAYIATTATEAESDGGRGSLGVRPAPRPSALPILRLTCRAPHHDKSRAPEPCGSFMGYGHGWLVFETTAPRAPALPDGYIWVRCTKRSCQVWNKFALVEPPDSPAAA